MTLTLSNGIASRGETATVTLSHENLGSEPTTAIGVSICHDPAIASVVAVTPSVGLRVGFEQISIEPAGWSSSVIASLLCLQTIPNGPLYEIDYDLTAVGFSSLTFCDAIGTPPVRTEIALEVIGVGLTIGFENLLGLGKLKIVCQGHGPVYLSGGL